MTESSINYQEGTRDKPEVLWSVSDSEISLRLAGDSEMEDAYEFYAPIMGWLKSALLLPERIPFTLTLDIRYCNTSSQKALLNIADALMEHYLGSNRTVHAVYKVHKDDEDLLDMVRELFDEWDSKRYTIETYE
jgi:hypothetical protein